MSALDSLRHYIDEHFADSSGAERRRWFRAGELVRAAIKEQEAATKQRDAVECADGETSTQFGRIA